MSRRFAPFVLGSCVAQSKIVHVSTKASDAKPACATCLANANLRKIVFSQRKNYLRFASKLLTWYAQACKAVHTIFLACFCLTCNAITKIYQKTLVEASKLLPRNAKTESATSKIEFSGEICGLNPHLNREKRRKNDTTEIVLTPLFRGKVKILVRIKDHKKRLCHRDQRSTLILQWRKLA